MGELRLQSQHMKLQDQGIYKIWVIEWLETEAYGVLFRPLRSI